MAGPRTCGTAPSTRFFLPRRSAVPTDAAGLCPRCPHAPTSGPSLRCFDSWTAWLERLEVRRWSVAPPSWARLTTGCARGAVWGGSKPQRGLGRLHGLANDCQQVGGEGAEVDLVAQAGAECADRLGGVVLAPVEAAVDRLLDAVAGRL